MAEQAQATDAGPRPIVPFLKLTPKPHLLGKKCSNCGALYVDKRVACSKCSSTAPFTDVALSNRGKVYVFSVVHQSFPGIKTPYITAIVDLPEGVSVRSNLEGLEIAGLQKLAFFGSEPDLVRFKTVVNEDRRPSIRHAGVCSSEILFQLLSRLGVQVVCRLENDVCLNALPEEARALLFGGEGKRDRFTGE